MDMNGERLIIASRTDVWAALNDIEILRACIPGCEKIESVSPTQMNASAALRVGPITAKLQGSVTLSDILPPVGYKLSFSGQGAAGFAKGSATVELVEQGEATLLRYTAATQIGGKLAQLGGRLIDSTAKAMTEQFFKKFATTIEMPALANEIESVNNGEKERNLRTVEDSSRGSTWFTAFWLWLKRVLSNQ